MMKTAQEIIDCARNSFDVAGMVKLPDGGRLLVLGLESTPERDLDEFRLVDDRVCMAGFEKHAGPALEALMNFLRKEGFNAELSGRCGYPLKGQIQLKEAAVRAGLGNWGKSTLVLHPEYGNRLRFMAVVTDAPLPTNAEEPVVKEENPTCADCTICLDSCTEDLLEAYHMSETGRCLANWVRITPEGDRLITCDICLRVCPAGTT
ncbi:MAG: hypothetical protein KAI14_02605 [Dehalococcoidales bacterium]|nr:hypothetical protein [Dehalococcoidales bacterium]